jgi:hypothetical protein
LPEGLLDFQQFAVSAIPFGTDTKACEFANLTMIRIGSRVLFRVRTNSVIPSVFSGVSSVFIGVGMNRL